MESGGPVRHLYVGVRINEFGYWFERNIRIYLPMQLTDWLVVEVELLLIGLSNIFLTKSSFDHTSVTESSLMRWA